MSQNCKLFYFLNAEEKNLGQFSKNLNFLFKNLSLISKNMWLGSWILDTGSGKKPIPDAGSGCRVKNSVADPGSGMGKNQDPGSGIWDKHPGSATLVKKAPTPGSATLRYNVLSDS
jgi:hypothetical protein